jgi:Helix-turn-helix of DDE superfamily endonuclease
MNWRYQDVRDNEAILRKLTGLKMEEFLALHQTFDHAWNRHFASFTLDGKPRARQASIRKNSIFSDTHDALLFCLIYLKNKTLQQELAHSFGIDQPKASRYLHLTRQLLLQSFDSTIRGVSRRKREWLRTELMK